MRPTTPEYFKIAGHAATFIREGSTLQTGIGAVPNLVAQALVQAPGGDCGAHSEMFTDGLFALARRARSPTPVRTRTVESR
jgi:acyl-CoA hydrolase